MTERVAILLLNWNSAEDTLDCIISLQQIATPPFDIILVDNGSEDDSVQKIRQIYPNLPLYETGENLGFAGGNNVGIERILHSNYEYILLLNTDTIVDADFLQKMVTYMDAHLQVGITGPVIYYYDDPHRIWSAGGKIDWQTGYTQMLHIGEEDRGQTGSGAYPVDFVTGCALMVRAKTLREAGLMDPRFFLYYEETEWCVRIKRLNWEIEVIPDAHIWHKISSVVRDASPIVQYYMARNRLLFLKIAQASKYAQIRALLGNLRTWLSYSLRPKWKSIRNRRKILGRATLDFLLGRFGQASIDLSTRE